MYKSEYLANIPGLFHRDCRYKLFLPLSFVYCVYPATSKDQKNCQI